MEKPKTVLEGELETEFRTVTAMMQIYCRKQHKSKQLCNDCESLLSYAETKLDRCPYGQDKPTCNNCPIHCYKPEPKEQMKVVMRFSGPRMLLSHPILAIRHLRHEKIAAPDVVPKNMSNRYIRLNRNKIS
ncbi:nitrous oxide-stimulated promoter family protein [Vibrio hannami]|uniref:nitrous oxide-stimulated promoter family protein n=1 Tax=Vibrio hannami TaxID=2717094 RepID=UPI002410303C|nr:nitrous oxide-stimulated promoter family protein [Vibrio hannami]MDG3085418.1 nitrous oxide-stimulated promoter family protein [Vibrio hannami]